MITSFMTKRVKAAIPSPATRVAVFYQFSCKTFGDFRLGRRSGKPPFVRQNAMLRAGRGKGPF